MPNSAPLSRAGWIRRPLLASHRRCHGKQSLSGSVIVGIDGGYLRNWHDKKRNFEVIVGKSMVEDRDDRYFGLVRSQDAAPKLRFCEVLRSQKLPVDQPVTVLAATASARWWVTCRPALSMC